MPNETKHTPTPWFATSGSIDGRDDVYCTGQEGTIAQNVRPQDAAFIVRACNAHDKLVEALEMVRDADEDCKKDGLPTIPDIARSKIDAALAAAKAGA